MTITAQEKARDYAKEYREYHSKPEQKKNRAKRNAGRRKLGLKKGDGKEVDHKKPLSKGGSNSDGNLRSVKRATNRKKGDSEARVAIIAALIRAGRPDLANVVASC
jgi:5-methylcytosine-specific restriction endonuclease McrA